MNKLKPIILDNGLIQIHPLRSSDLMKHDKIVNDLFEIFSDSETLTYNKEKIVTDKKTVAMQLLGVSMGYEQQLRYTHFLTLKEYDKVIGEILILSPKSVEPSYNIKDTWIIEYFLNKQLWNNGIMTGVIQVIIEQMQEQDINKIGVLVDRDNLSSIRVLQKVGFIRIKQFDLKQDYYEISNSSPLL